jgi:tetratricopeptide (TPR) repeat protein
MGNRSSGQLPSRAARAYYRMGKPEKALLAISRWFVVVPANMRNGDMYENRARMFERLGRYSEAAEDLSMALQATPPGMQSDLLLCRAIARAYWDEQASPHTASRDCVFR